MIVLLVVLSSYQPHLLKRMVILSNVENALAPTIVRLPADPFPIVKNLRRDIKTITDEELQLGITDAFGMIRDHHHPADQYSTIRLLHATTGVEFAFIEGDADLRAALDYLTTIYGKSTACQVKTLSSSNSIQSYPKNRYTVNVPYVSGHNEECWNLGSKLYKSLPSKTLPGTPETSLLVAQGSLDIVRSQTLLTSPPRVTKRTVSRIPKRDCYGEDV
ncbi:hypothetical protein BASA83_008115 [Batrachochytrium salamandrivorans]|nr:hypothetical protein BASA83_008115 [Batrachochytrium salamandrivorans]